MFSVPDIVAPLLVMKTMRGSLDARRRGTKLCVMTCAPVTLTSQALFQACLMEAEPSTTLKSQSRPLHISLDDAGEIEAQSLWKDITSIVNERIEPTVLGLDLFDSRLN